MEEEFEQVLLGSLLGDGSISKNKNKIKNDTFYYHENHSAKQKEYSLWKKSILEKHLILKTLERVQLDKTNNKNYNVIKMRSKNNNVLKPYYYMFYSSCKKTVTKEILDKLMPLGIAVWYLDDGTYDYWNKRITLATNSFLLEENKLIVNFFNKKYNIEFKILEIKYENRMSTYYLYSSIREAKKFISLIENYVPKCMSYKLGKDEDKIVNREEHNKYQREYRKKRKIEITKIIEENKNV